MPKSTTVTTRAASKFSAQAVDGSCIRPVVGRIRLIFYEVRTKPPRLCSFLRAPSPTRQARIAVWQLRRAALQSRYSRSALKFTSQGEVRVSAVLRVEFAVSDTGIGIAKDHLPALFADFVQIDTRIQKRLKGTGWGERWRGNLLNYWAAMSVPRGGSRLALLRRHTHSL